MKSLLVIFIFLALLLVRNPAISQIVDRGETSITNAPQEKSIKTQVKVPPDFVPYDKEPTVIKKVDPEYPKKALADSLEGNVFLKVWVDTSGNVLKPEIINSDDEIFNDAALAAARQWKFAPASINGKPVAVWVSIPFRFRLTARSSERTKPPVTNPNREKIIGNLTITVLDILAGKEFEETKASIDPAAFFIDGDRSENLRAVAKRWNKSPDIGRSNLAFVQRSINDEETAAILVMKIISKDKKQTTFHTVTFFKSTSGDWVIQSWHVSGLSSPGNGQSKTAVLDYPYNVRTFSTGANVRQITIKTQNGDPIATMEIPKRFCLAVYADKMKPIDHSKTEYSGMISIRTKPDADMKNGVDGRTQMAQGVAKLEFPDAIVTVTTIED